MKGPGFPGAFFYFMFIKRLPAPLLAQFRLTVASALPLRHARSLPLQSLPRIPEPQANRVTDMLKRVVFAFRNPLIFSKLRFKSDAGDQFSYNRALNRCPPNSERKASLNECLSG